MRFSFRLCLFWLAFFLTFRLWFILWLYSEWPSDSPFSAFGALYGGIPLDLSMMGYLVAVPIVFYFLGILIGKKIFPYIGKLISWFNIILIVVTTLAFGANVFLYQEWHTPLNNRALAYLSTPQALLASMSLHFVIVCVLLYLVLVWGIVKLYKRWIPTNPYPDQVSRWAFGLLIPVVALLALAIRGGLGVMPINESAVYYSPHLFNNHAATNTLWHLIHSQLEVRSTVNHYKTMETKEAKQWRDVLFFKNISAEDFTYDFIKQDSANPVNIVYVIMESMTAQVIEELGGEKGVCPNLSRCIQEGILFENCYGSGYRTDQGLVSVLGGYPAQPDQSIILQIEKAAKLSSIPKILKQKGYSTLFCYGGELTFANIGVWLNNQQFNTIKSQSDFEKKDINQRWGVDDKRIFQYFINQVGQLKPPFFATTLTLSLHPPYDVPHTSQWNENSDKSKFLNSASFADEAIGQFLAEAKLQPWFSNTLFFFVADHGVSPPTYVGLDNPRSRQIPLIIWGEPLNNGWRGHRNSIFVSHHDIPATTLSMLNMKQQAKDLPWSRDVWFVNSLINGYKSPQKPILDRLNFAYYTNESGVGWCTPSGIGFYRFGDKNWHIWNGSLDSTARKQATAYLQVLYDDFLEK